MEVTKKGPLNSNVWPDNSPDWLKGVCPYPRDLDSSVFVFLVRERNNFRVNRTFAVIGNDS